MTTVVIDLLFRLGAVHAALNLKPVKEELVGYLKAGQLDIEYIRNLRDILDDVLWQCEVSDHQRRKP